MLQGMTEAWPPAFLISAAASSHTGALRDDTTTLAPESARCMAIDLPIPLLEPVTTATLPVRSKSGDAMRFPPFILLSPARGRGICRVIPWHSRSDGGSLD